MSQNIGHRVNSDISELLANRTHSNKSDVWHTRIHSEKSKIWVYFKQCEDDSDKVRCNLCSIKLRNFGATSILWNHVKVKHSIERHTTNEDNRDSSSDPNMTSTKLKNGNNAQNSSKLLDSFIDNDSMSTSMKPSPSSSLSKNLISRLNQISSPVTRKLKFWNKKSFQVNQYDPSFKVIYLGNLAMQLWSKDENCLEKPLNTLWNNYIINMKREIIMRLTICNSGLKALTRQHGLTQYWSNRLVFCCSHKDYPRIFSWVYRHEGKKMRQELRCHAVFCPSPEKAIKMVTMLNQRLACALQEFRREKKSRGLDIVSNSNSLVQQLPRTIPLRRQILAKGSANFRPPLERSKSAPKLSSILEEDYDSDQFNDEFELEESSGDRIGEEEHDNEDDDDDSDYDDTELGRDDEDSSQKIESNSLSTTTNEETSNGSFYANGDKFYEKSRQGSTDKALIDSMNEQPIGTLNKANCRLPSDAHLSLEESSGLEDEFDTRINETPSYLSLANSSEIQVQDILQSSANTITTISSFPIQKVASEEQDTESLLMHEAKNNNTSSNKIEPQSENQGSEDKATQDIILSWSNLVIN